MGRLLIAGVVALAGCLCITLLEGTFQMSEEMQQYSAPFPPGVEEQRDAEQIVADRKNMGMIGALMGAVICGCLACAALAGSAGSGVKGGIVGLVFGAGLGGLGGVLSTTLFKYLLVNPIEPFADTVLVQGSLTVAIGIGLAATLLFTASGVVRKQLPIVLIVVSAISSVLYPFAAAVAFPLLKSHQTIPESIANRALWLGLPILLSAIAVARSLVPKADQDQEMLASVADSARAAEG